MKRTLFTALAVVLFLTSASAQSKSNDAIAKQIKKLHSEKNITVSYDGNTSKVMAVAENFSDSDSSRAGVQAINFALGFFFFGDKLEAAPDPILFSFWILSKKPRFGDDHDVNMILGNDAVSLGDVRYVAKRKEDIEYINCKITREQLALIVKNQNPSVKIGKTEFRFTADQIRTLAGMLSISDPEVFN